MKNSSPKSRAPVAASSATSSTSSASDGDRPPPSNVHAPDPEVLERPKRRSFTAEYKLRVLREVDAAKASGDSGAVGAALRHEGLYSSHLVEWRKQRESGELEGLKPVKRGPKPSKRHDPLALENERLRRENARLEEALRKAAIVIDVQKKVATLLGIPIESPKTEQRS